MVPSRALLAGPTTPRAGAHYEGSPDLTALHLTLGAALALAGYSWARVEVAGLLFQPYLLPLGFLFIRRGLAIFRRVPRPVMSATITFVAVYAVDSLGGTSAPANTLRAVVMGLTIAGVAACATSERDVRAATLGFALGMGFVSTVALLTTAIDASGLDPFADTGNKNAFSLYVLPALLLAGFQLLDGVGPRWQRVVFAVCIAAMAVAVLSTGNRSGWVGVALTGVLLLLRRRRFREVVVVATLAGSIAYYVSHSDATTVIETRLANTENIEVGDDLRLQLLDAAIDIGLEHPILGVSPGNVPDEIGERIGFEALHAHNLFAEMFAAGGFPLLLALVGVLAALWLTPATNQRSRQRAILRSMIVLFVVRSMFTSDSLFVPPFLVGIALCLAPLLPTGSTTDEAPRRELSDVYARERARRAAQRSSQL